MKKKQEHPIGWDARSLTKILRIMKVSLLLLFIGVFELMASNVLAQNEKVTVGAKKTSIRQVLAEIEKQSEYRFFYNEGLINVNREITLEETNQSVNDILEEIFKGTDVVYKIIQENIILTNLNRTTDTLQEDYKVIKGTVVDAHGEPLPGVNVFEKADPTKGVITNFDGAYSIEVSSPDAVIQYSFIGFEGQTVNARGRTEINITLLEEMTDLDEVVVVGYGVQKKADLTGAISSVSGEKLLKAPTPNLASALTGKVTGVSTTQASGQPGAENVKFQIRGISTTKNNDPLIIVDGVVRSFSRIDPNEIESVTVLKDAASTAVYGARAANGVLLITTKRGKTGEASFNYTGSYGFQMQTRKIDMMNAYEFTKYINEARANYNEELSYTEEEIEKYRTGELPSYDWLDAIFDKSAPQQRHSISVTGGTDKVKYFLSYGYLNQQGLYKTAKYKQNNIRSNIDVQLSERLKVGADLSGRIEDRTKAPVSDQDIYQGATMSRPYLNPRPVIEGVPDALGFNGQSGSPIGTAERTGTRKDIDYVFQSNFSLNYEVPGVKGLTAKALYSFDFRAESDKTFTHPYTVYVLNEANGAYRPQETGPSTTSLNERRDFIKQSTLQLSLNYTKSFENHNFSGLFLFEQMESNDNTLEAYRRDFISTTKAELFGGGVDLWKNYGKSAETARRGYVGRIDYDYKGKYLLQANMRFDQSFNFPDDGRNGFFPAFSAGWRISEEDFISSDGIISNLKLRASWGITGNDRVPKFQYLSAFEFDKGSVIGESYVPGIMDTGLPNPNITWETATTLDVGFDFGLFNNKLSGEFDYFKKRTEDILTPRASVPGTIGAKLPDENIGIVDSWGTEGAIKYTNKIGEFNFTLGANVSWFNNEAVYLDEPINVLPSIAETGRELNLPVGYLSDGLFQSEEEIKNAPIHFSDKHHSGLRPGDIRYRDINGRDENGNLTGKPDGKVNSDDQAIIGDSELPNLIYGFSLDLEYKGFDLTASFQGASNYSRFIQPVPFARGGNTYKEMVDSWRVGNEDAAYPRLKADDLSANSAKVSDFWQKDVRYLRLRNFEVGYNCRLLKNTYSKAGIESMRIFISGSNLLTFSNLKWRDPEGASGSNPFYPQVKTISMGLNVKF